MKLCTHLSSGVESAEYLDLEVLMMQFCIKTHARNQYYMNHKAVCLTLISQVKSTMSWATNISDVQSINFINSSKNGHIHELGSIIHLEGNTQTA